MAFCNSGWDSRPNCKKAALQGELGANFAREIKKLDTNFVSKLVSRGGGASRTRTYDPIDVNDVLYRLSHGTMSLDDM